MGLIPSSPDVEVGFLQSATNPDSFLRCELTKNDKTLKNVSWSGFFGKHTEAHPPIVGKFSRSGMTTIVCLFHLPETSYFFPYRQNGMPIETGSLEDVSAAFSALSAVKP